MQVRINKFISESGYCSRREADKYIEQGCVTIDGKKAVIGSQVSPGQVVKLLGELIENKAQSILIAYNKPVGVVSTTDLSEPNNIVDAIGHDERIFPIGRLDKDSQGLIILTNEGDIVNKILRVNNNHDKEYFVVVDKPVTDDFITKMQNGVPILGVVTRKCELTKRDVNSFHIVLRQGLNRQIRRMCEYLGYNVIKLERIRVMHIKLGSLRVGQWRNLTQIEVEVLRKKIASSVKTEEASRTKTKIKSKPSKFTQPKAEDKQGKSKPSKSFKPSKFTQPKAEDKQSKSKPSKSFKPSKFTQPKAEDKQGKSKPSKSFKPSKFTQPEAEDKQGKSKPSKSFKPSKEQSKVKSKFPKQKQNNKKRSTR